MPRVEKTTYTDKQKRQARHIEDGYANRAVGNEKAAGRTVVTNLQAKLGPALALESPFNTTRYSLAASSVLAVVSLVLLCLTYY